MVVTGDQDKLKASIADLKTKIENKKKAIEQTLYNFLQDPLAGISQDILALSRYSCFIIVYIIIYISYFCNV